MSLVSADNLTCIKRDRVLFEALAFQLQKGELVHLKGVNGAGKTSLMRIIAGLSLPTEGEVHYQQVPLSQCWESYTSSILYIGHKASTSATLNALENTCFWAAQQGITLSEPQIEETLLMLGLAGLEDIPVSMLSAGQQRRVALARLWLKPNTHLWLLDEPFTALDVDGVALIESKMHAHVEQGGSVLLTSHQPLRAHEQLREWTLEYRF